MAMHASQKAATVLCAVSLIGGLAATSALAGSDAPARVDRSYANPQPPYPDTAQSNGEQGTILVDVLVRASGKPAGAKVERSSGYRDLDDAAVQGVLNWRFVPAMRGGDWVKDWTTVKVVYQLPTLMPPASPAAYQKP